MQITQEMLNDGESEVALAVMRGLTMVRVENMREPDDVIFHPIALSPDAVHSWGTPVSSDVNVSPLEFHVRVNGVPYRVLPLPGAIREQLARDAYGVSTT